MSLFPLLLFLIIVINAAESKSIMSFRADESRLKSRSNAPSTSSKSSHFFFFFRERGFSWSSSLKCSTPRTRTFLRRRATSAACSSMYIHDENIRIVDAALYEYTAQHIIYIYRTNGPCVSCMDQVFLYDMHY